MCRESSGQTLSSESITMDKEKYFIQMRHSIKWTDIAFNSYEPMTQSQNIESEN